MPYVYYHHHTYLHLSTYTINKTVTLTRKNSISSFLVPTITKNTCCIFFGIFWQLLAYLEVKFESRLIRSPSSSSSVQEKDSNPSSIEWEWPLLLTELFPFPLHFDAFRSVLSSSSSSDHQGGSPASEARLLFTTLLPLDSLQEESFLGVLLFGASPLTKVSSERSSLISSVLAMGARPSGWASTTSSFLVVAFTTRLGLSFLGDLDFKNGEFHKIWNLRT